jgi:urease accessory protein
MAKRNIAAGVAAGAVLLGSMAFAHPGHEEASFATAFAHPWSGWDHMLAMVAVGYAGAAAAGRGTRAGYLAPVAFLLAMTAGAVGAWGGAPVGWAEAGILASIAAAAVLVFFGGRMGVAAVIGLAAASGLPHGAAHGAELSQGADALAGFLSATALLHALGIVAAIAAMRMLGRDRPALR